MKDAVEGYKIKREPKVKILYSRMDDTMINRLKEIRDKTGISISEIIREGVRRLLAEIEESGSFSLKI
jgi:predicted DNA-binding protein